MAASSGVYGGRRDTADADGASQREPLCPICMALLLNQPIGTPECCDHRFCLSCLREWAQNANNCPIDRQSFNIIRCHSTGRNGFKTIYVDDRTLPSADDPTYCEVCSRCNREDEMLLCDGCDRGYHLRCLKPPLYAVPHGEWYCTPCMRIISSAMRSRTVQTSTSPNPSSSTDGGTRQGSRRACRSGYRKDSLVDQRTVPMGRARGRRTSRGGRVAQVQPGVPESSLTGDRTDDSADSDEHAMASGEDDESEVDDSDERESSDADSDEDYHPRSVKDQMTRGRRVHTSRAKCRLALRKRGMGGNLTGKGKSDGQKRRIVKKVESLRKTKGKVKGKKAKKRATASVVKKSRVVLQPLQPEYISQLRDRRRSSGLIRDAESARNCTSIGEARLPGPSARLQTSSGTETSGPVVGVHGSNRISTARNKYRNASGNVDCSDDVGLSSSEECPQLLQETDMPILNGTQSPPLLDLECEAVGTCNTLACDTIASEQISNTAVSRISRHTKAKCRGKSRVYDRSTVDVASSAAANFPDHGALESNVPWAKKGNAKTKGRSTVSGSGRDKARLPNTIVLPIGTPETAGRIMRSAGDRAMTADKAPVSVLNEACDALSETATTSQAAVTQVPRKRCTKKSSVKVNTRQSGSDGEVLVSSSPESVNGLSLSAVTRCDSQQSTAASKPCFVGITEAVTTLSLVRESTEPVPTSCAERSSSNEPAVAKETADATITARATFGSHRGDRSAVESRSLSDSASNGKYHLSTYKSSLAATDSRLPFSERAAPAATGTAPSCVSTVDCEKGAFSDAPGTSPRIIAADASALVESSEKLDLSIRKVRRGPRTPSPPPPSSSDDDDHRSRSPLRHRLQSSLTSISVVAPESPIVSAAGAKDASSALPVEDSGADKRVPTPKATTEHERTCPAAETCAAGPQSALKSPRPDHGSSSGAAAAKQGNSVDSRKEYGRYSVASGVSKSSAMCSTVARETVFEKRIYHGREQRIFHGHYRAGLDSRICFSDVDHGAAGYTGDAYSRSSGGFAARVRATDAHSTRSLDRASHLGHSRTAYRCANRGGTFREQRMPTAETGWLVSSRTTIQYNKRATRENLGPFNGPVPSHIRQSSSRSVGPRRQALLPDPVTAATSERLGRVDRRPPANGFSFAMGTGDYSVESEEWGEGESGEAFVDRYEHGEVDYEYNYEDDGDYNEVDGDYEQGDGVYEEGDGVYEEGDGVYEEGDGVYDEGDGVYDEVGDGASEEVDGVYEEVDGVYEEVDRGYDEVGDGGERYYDDNEMYCEEMTSVHYNVTEPIDEVDPQFVSNDGGWMLASDEMPTVSTRNSSRAQWRVPGYDGGRETHRGNFPAGFPNFRAFPERSRSSGRGLLPLPPSSARLFPSREDHRDRRMPVGKTVSSQSSSQWLADWLQKQNLQSSPTATPFLSGYRGPLPLNPGGHSARQGVRSIAYQRDSPAAASFSGGRGLLGPFVPHASALFDNVSAHLRVPQWRPPLLGVSGSVPCDPRVRPSRIAIGGSSTVPVAALRRHNDPPSSASAAGMTRKMANPECSGSIPKGESSRLLIVPETGRRAEKCDMNVGASSAATNPAEVLESRDVGGSPMVLSSPCSPTGATSPDVFSLTSVAVSRTPSPSALCCGNGQSTFGCNPASNAIASAASTSGSTSAETSSGVVAVGGSAVASNVHLVVTEGNATTSPCTTATIVSNNVELAAAATAKSEDPKLREIAVIVERHLMVAHMAGRIDTATYKSIAKKAVSKIYKQEKGSKLDENRIQKLVEAYVVEADVPLSRLK